MSVTIGLREIKTGTAGADGTMPVSMTKMGKVYKDSCKVSQDAAEVTEHFEEGVSAPVYRKKTKKVPVVTAQIIVENVQQLADYIGGTISDGVYGFDGTEVVANRAVSLTTEQGLDIEIPNADVEAQLNSDLSATGICLFDVTFTPMTVSSGKAFRMKPKNNVSFSPTSLSFTSSADSTGKDVTMASTGNVEAASVEAGCDWATVTYTGKVVKVKVTANANTDARSTLLTVRVDGGEVTVPVTQAGA